MPTITFVDHSGTARAVAAEPGYSLMEVARINAIPGIDADCGGMCACATCHIFIDTAFLHLAGQRSEDEESLLEFVDGADERSRLACQVMVDEALNGLVVTTPESQD